jgi:hypothetical protein
VLLRHAPWALDLLLGLLMLSSVLIMTAYVGALAPALTPQASYSTYDAVETAAARWFLPRKDSSPAVAASAAAAAARGAVNISSTSVTGVVTAASLQLPGSSGRWLLPDADGDMDALAGLLCGVSRCTAAWSLYGLVQCLVLLLFLLQLLLAWSFQPRLGIITQTLVAALPAIGHLCLVIAFCMVAFAAVLTLAVGTWAAPAATFGSAWYDMFLQLLAGSEVGLGTLFPPGVVLTSAQQLLSGLILYMREALFAFVLMSYFLAALGATFAAVKRAADAQARARSAIVGPDAKQRSIAADLVVHVLPEWAAAAQSAAWRLQDRDSSSGAGQKRQGWLKGRWGSTSAVVAPEQRDTEAGAIPEGEEVEEVATTLEGPLRRKPRTAQRQGQNIQHQHQQRRQQGVGWSCCQLHAWLPAPSRGQLQPPAHLDLRDAVPLWQPRRANTLGSVPGRDQCSTPGAALDREALQLLVLGQVLEDQQRTGAGGRGAAGAGLATELVQEVAQQQSVLLKVRRLVSRAARRRSTYGGGSSVTELPPGWQEAPVPPAAAGSGAGPGISSAAAVEAAAAAVAAAVLRALGVPASPASVAAGKALLQQESSLWATSAGTSSSSSALQVLSAEAGQAVVTLKVTPRPGWGAQGEVQQQVYAALWVAVREMQQWANAAHRWHQQVAKEVALWSQQGEQLAARHLDARQVLPVGALPSSMDPMGPTTSGSTATDVTLSSPSAAAAAGGGLRKRVSASGRQQAALDTSDGRGLLSRDVSGAGSVHQQQQQQQQQQEPRAPAALAVADPAGPPAGDSAPATPGVAAAGLRAIRSFARLKSVKPAAPLSLLGQLLGSSAGKDGKGGARPAPAVAAAVPPAATAGGASVPAAAATSNIGVAPSSSGSGSSGATISANSAAVTESPAAASCPPGQAPSAVDGPQSSSVVQLPLSAASTSPDHVPSERPATSSSHQQPLAQEGQEAGAADATAERG